MERDAARSKDTNTRPARVKGKENVFFFFKYFKCKTWSVKVAFDKVVHMKNKKKHQQKHKYKIN